MSSDLGGVELQTRPIGQRQHERKTLREKAPYGGIENTPGYVAIRKVKGGFYPGGAIPWFGSPFGIYAVLSSCKRGSEAVSTFVAIMHIPRCVT